MSDLISRQAVIDALEDAEDAFGYLTKDWREVLEQLPPIQPKKGRWIKLDMHRGMADHKCSVCEQECYVPTCMGEPLYAYCPNCGAKMGVME